MNLHRIALTLAASSILLACGSDPDSPSLDRAGPESLAGVAWGGDVFNAGNGVTIEPAFRFTQNSVILDNECTGGGSTIRAEATAPVRYHYTVDTDGQRSGDAACSVEILSGRSEFEVVDGRLRWTFGGEQVDFEAAGPVAGLFGDWTADNDLGRFRFALGGGVLTASIDCNSGGSASVTVNATYRSFVDILDSASDETMEGGLTCNADIQAASNVEYRFDGDALVMIFDSGELRLEP